MLIPLGFLAGSGGVEGDYELIESVILGSAQSSVTFSSLATYASTYKHLQIRAVAKGTSSGAELVTLMTFNADTTTTNYRTHQLFGFNGSVGSSDTVSFARQMIGYTARADVTNVFGAIVIDILDPYSTTKNKTSRSLSGNVAGTGASAIVNLQSHLWMNTAAVSSATIATLSGNFIAGSRFSLYGIKG
jgi:hypothetical protein